jgi:DNA-binding CsgD family transcriptional regulator
MNYSLFLEKWLFHIKETHIIAFTSNRANSELHYKKIITIIDDTISRYESNIVMTRILSDKNFRNSAENIISQHIDHTSMSTFMLAFKLFKQCVVEIINESGVKGTAQILPEVGKVFDAMDVIFTDIYHMNSINKLRNMLQQVTNTTPKPKPIKIGSKSMTQTEHKICEYIKEGLSTKEIAEKMNVVISTVQTHRKRIRKKLNINNKQSLYNHLKENVNS